MSRAGGPFKSCGACRHAWPTWDSFVHDPRVRLLGLQAGTTNPDSNLLVFEHGCGSSISILAPRLRHLLPDPPPRRPDATLLDTGECRGRCRKLGDLEPCDAECRNARDRELIGVVQRIKADLPGAPSGRQAG